MKPGSFQMIAVDWGATRFRAHLVDADGHVVASRRSDEGLATLFGGDFEAILVARCGDWIAAHPGIPLAMAGMVGGRSGWREAPYVPCPAGPAEIEAALLRFTLADGTPASIVPGVASEDERTLDVMRGEETQILGTGATDAVVVLPGAHSKWAVVRGGRIVYFHTYMTGEFYSLLRQHSILRLLDGPVEPARETAARDAAFDSGLVAAGRQGGILHQAFMARTGALFGAFSGAGVGQFLSGLMIGAEIAAARALVPSDLPLHLVADGEVARRYRRALAAVGLSATTRGGRETFLAGLSRLALTRRKADHHDFS